MALTLPEITTTAQYELNQQVEATMNMLCAVLVRINGLDATAAGGDWVTAVAAMKAAAQGIATYIDGDATCAAGITQGSLDLIAEVAP